MVRISEWRRAAALLATVFAAAAMLSGCASDSPRTHLDWYPQSDAAPHRQHVASNVPPVHPAPAPRRHRHATPPAQTASVDCPVPRAKPGWYTQTDTPPASQPATYTPAPPAAGGTMAFAWPLAGQVISDFGSTANGGRNDGINIAAPSGTPIHAAAAGQISYAGNELRGYGNLILIKHDNGYVTAYAHADRITVNRGDMVAKGQVIGYAGQTGDVASPQLHFEIRKGVQPVNPRTLLNARTASAS
ncbi:MAG: M23 family metallopeptidase [Rhizomicrobium sp.]